MFYCNGCAEKKKWPLTLFKSQGACEICGKESSCNETPCKDLPEEYNVDGTIKE